MCFAPTPQRIRQPRPICCVGIQSSWMLKHLPPRAPECSLAGGSHAPATPVGCCANLRASRGAWDQVDRTDACATRIPVPRPASIHDVSRDANRQSVAVVGSETRGARSLPWCGDFLEDLRNELVRDLGAPQFVHGCEKYSMPEGRLCHRPDVVGCQI